MSERIVVGAGLAGLCAAINLRREGHEVRVCLLYTSDAADDLLCVDLGGSRIIKNKTLSN